jgi:hypothetical protein
MLAALLATVGLASALRPFAGLGGDAQAFADHDGDASAPRSCSRSPVTVFQAAGLVQLARTAGPPPRLAPQDPNQCSLLSPTSFSR